MLAWVAAQQRAGCRGGQGRQAHHAPAKEAGEASWEDLVPVDTLGLEVGYRLITLVDKSKEGDLLNRIKGVRRKFAQEVGFLPPPVHIRDNLELRPSQYRISLRGAVVGEAEAFPACGWPSTRGHATQKLHRHADHRPRLRPAGRVDRGAAEARWPK